MAVNFPVTQMQFEQHLKQHGFITDATLEDHLQQANYVTGAKMREWVMGALKTEHDELEARLTQSVQVVKDGVQAVHESVVQAHADFEARVGAANTTFEHRQSGLAAGFAQSDAPPREHLNNSQ